MYPEYSIPGTCRATGLDCENCTSMAARNIARLCHGLRGKDVGRLFVQLYPHPACAPMHGQFAAAYREADGKELCAAAGA
jgi:hypothetical protein